MEIIKPSIPRGTRDFLPEQMLRRQYVINTIKNIFEKYGYEPLETPAIEKLQVLSGKYGEEGEQLMFKILRRGTGIEKVGKDLLEFTVTNFNDLVDFALRYDLTVPLSRVIAMYQSEITMPFKRYQIQPVWRADRPQKGRYREFYQCDIDTVGTYSMLADAENIAVVSEILSTLGFNKFKIRINNRKILSGIVEYSGVDINRGNDVCIAIDKLEKIGLDGVIKDMQKRDIPQQAIDKILPILEIKGEPVTMLNDVKVFLKDSEVGMQGIAETQELLSFINELTIPASQYTLDLYLARGLSYYTGPIYESILENYRIGSLTGGGRYDNLIGMFLGKNIPATGTTIGIERIIDVMTELDMLPATRSASKVLVTVFDKESRKYSLNVVKKLRDAGINSEIFFNSAKLKKQFNYANKKGIPYVIVIGPEEAENNQATLKNMTTGDQQQLSIDEIIQNLK